MKTFGVSDNAVGICPCGKIFRKKAHNQKMCSVRCKESSYEKPRKQQEKWARDLARRGKLLPSGQPENIKRVWQAIWSRRIFG